MRSEALKTGAALALLLLVTYLLESAVFSLLPILGVSPMLLPLLAVGVGLLGGGLWGCGFGLAAGILCGISAGSGGLLLALSLCVGGFFSGFLGEFVLARGFPSFAALSLGMLLLLSLLQLFPFAVYERFPLGPLLVTGLKQTLYSLLFLLPAYFCVRRAFRPLRRSKTN